MLVDRLGLLFWIASATAACSSDAEPDAQGSATGGAGSGGAASATGGAGSGGAASASAGDGGAASASAGSGGAASASAGDGGAADGGSAGAAPAALNFGDLGGASFEAQSSNATFNEVPGDRAYVSISINGWNETCDMALVCGEEQLNVTLYAIGGTRDDVRPGSYDVGSTTDGDVTYEVVGGAGRYDDACTTGGGFDSLGSGTLTIAAIADGRVRGEVDFTLGGGETLSGAFDAIDCTE